MITLQSSPAQIRKELDEDEDRAFYWFIKQYHGDAGFKKWRTMQCKRLWLSNDMEWFSDPVEYKSPNGNRWLSYERIWRDRQGGCYSGTYSVCYFETLGSVGAYIRINSERSRTGERMPGYIHYTSHFFQRFAERLGLEYRSRGMMLRFLQLAHSHYITTRPPRPGFKDTEIVMRYPASFALGTMCDVDGYKMITVRTFLPVTMLTPAKRRELEKFGTLIDKCTNTFGLDLTAKREAKTDYIYL